MTTCKRAVFLVTMCDQNVHLPKPFLNLSWVIVWFHVCPRRGEGMQDMQCMILTPNNSLLLGGHRAVVMEYDVQAQQEIRQVSCCCGFGKQTGSGGCSKCKFLVDGVFLWWIVRCVPRTFKSSHLDWSPHFFINDGISGVWIKVCVVVTDGGQ